MRQGLKTNVAATFSTLLLAVTSTVIYFAFTNSWALLVGVRSTNWQGYLTYGVIVLAILVTIQQLMVRFVFNDDKIGG